MGGALIEQDTRHITQHTIVWLSAVFGGSEDGVDMTGLDVGTWCQQ